MTTTRDMTPSVPRTESPTRWLWFIMAVALTFVHLYVRTRAVRFGNFDDVEFQAVANANLDQPYLTEAAEVQGRFYFASPFYRFLLISPYRLNVPAFTALRIGLLLAEAALLGWLFARLTGDRFMGAAVTLVIIAALHLPPTFFPVLSYPPMSVGFISLLGALHVHLTQSRHEATCCRAAAPLLFLFACLCLELFVVAAPLFLALSAYHRRNLAFALRESAVVLLAAVGFVLVYFNFAHQFPSHYGGTRWSLALVPAAGVVVRQMIGIIPGFELVVNRNLHAPVLLPWREVVRSLGEAPLMDLLVGVVQGMTASWLVASSRVARGSTAVVAAVAVLFAALLNVPIGLSEKYQVFLYHREFPYIYGFFSFCFMVAASLVFASVAANRWTRFRPWILGLASAVLVATCVAAKVSNHVVLRRLAERYPPVTAASHADDRASLP